MRSTDTEIVFNSGTLYKIKVIILFGLSGGMTIRVLSMDVRVSQQN